MASCSMAAKLTRSTTYGDHERWRVDISHLVKRLHSALLASAEALGSIAHAIPSAFGLGLVTAGAVAAWSVAGLMLPGGLLIADRVATILLQRPRL